MGLALSKMPAHNFCLALLPVCSTVHVQSFPHLPSGNQAIPLLI